MRACLARAYCTETTESTRPMTTETKDTVHMDLTETRERMLPIIENRLDRIEARIMAIYRFHEREIPSYTIPCPETPSFPRSKSMEKLHFYTQDFVKKPEDIVQKLEASERELHKLEYRLKKEKVHQERCLEELGNLDPSIYDFANTELVKEYKRLWTALFDRMETWLGGRSRLQDEEYCQMIENT